MIISTALRENRLIEWIAYAMTLGLFLLGVVLLASGLLSSGDLISRVPILLGGSAAEVLLLPALRFAIKARRHNLFIRMIGILLDRLENPKALVPVLEQLLAELLGEKD
jgi:hypothetical protein